MNYFIPAGTMVTRWTLGGEISPRPETIITSKPVTYSEADLVPDAGWIDPFAFVFELPTNALPYDLLSVGKNLVQCYVSAEDVRRGYIAGLVPSHLSKEIQAAKDAINDAFGEIGD